MKIAVIMSVYSHDTLSKLKESVSSILNQTYTDIHFYIQCDGSLPSEIDNYLSNLNDDRISIYKRFKNKGLAVSLNELLHIILHKNYEYIARMDADDYSLPNRLFQEYQYLETNLDVDCVGTWAIEIDNNGNEYYRKKMPTNHEQCLELFKKRDCFIHPTVMFRRTFFEKAGLYPENTYFGEDTMMWANGFAYGCKFANIPEYLYKFRLDDNFFDRRRGWKHAQSIFILRHKVNKMLGFSYKEDLFALFYFIAKLMPSSILSLIYKHLR